MDAPTRISWTRERCEALDRSDPLATRRALFRMPPGVYLDGNSLGLLPVAAQERVADVVADEWGRGLIRSWNAADWIHLPRLVGEKLAALIGAEPGSVLATDSTSINLFKLLAQEEAKHKQTFETLYDDHMAQLGD